MPPNDCGDDHYVAGAHGTVAEQTDEAYYDDRSDADDDMEKGRIKFPQNKLYGRDRELETLRNIFYQGLSSEETQDGCVVEMPEQASRVVFLSGYSGVGKSALVKEFVKQVQAQQKMNKSSSESVLHFSGKYSEQSSAAAPFSAISDLFSQMTHALSRKKSDKEGNELQSKILNDIGSSDLLAANADGDRVLRGTFPVLAALLDASRPNDSNNKSEEGGGGAPSMNAVKESVHELLSIISGPLKRPLILFLDDLQWADAPSLDLLSFLLSTDAQMKNVMFICAYRSNEVGQDHPFASIMDNVKESMKDDVQLVETVDLFSLSQDVITQFIAVSIGKEEEVEEVTELAEVVYQKTMGNIFCVMQAMEELVRKNALYYDMMCFEWRWAVSKVELSTTISDDVVETVKGKIKELSSEIQYMLIVMAYVPNTLEVPVLTELMKRNSVSLDESRVAELLKKATEEALLMYSAESDNYIFIHDRIREASRGSIADEDKDDLLLHLSLVLQKLAKGPETEWCLFVAVDLLNSLPSEKTNCNDLARLNMRVSVIARNRGIVEKQSELLHEGLQCLKSSGKLWEDYNLTLSLLNDVIPCDRELGCFDEATAAIDEVLANGKTLDDKFIANVNQFMVKCDSSRDYGTAIEDGIKILNMYGYKIPLKPTKADVVKEEMKAKMALKNRPYSCLAEIPVKDDPIFQLFAHVCECAIFQSHERLLTVLLKRLIRRVIDDGMGKEFPCTFAILGVLMQKKGKVQASTEIGNVTLLLLEKFKSDKIIYARTKMIVIATLGFQLQSFRSQVDALLHCHKDLKFVGSIENAMGAAIGYFCSYLSAGFPLGPLLESKLQIVEEYGYRYDKGSFAVLFKMLRQFAINLRQRSDNPSEFNGDAYNEEDTLNGMNEQKSKMMLRDSGAYRIQLAFIFGDRECMTSMLDILSTYPYTFHDVTRLHPRLCFMGLSAFAVKYKNKEVGEKCLEYFQKLTKAGSLNAKPVYLFMLAMKKPSKSAFESAIDATKEASTLHLEAMVKEHYGLYLQQQNEDKLANDCLASSYFSYYDWGAHSKALRMTQQYHFLAKTSRIKAKSLFSASGCTETSSQSQSVEKSSVSSTRRVSYVYNSTFRSKKEVKEKS
eukprot:scaffold18962_cov140-Skeletonema_marinoi.AAC.4